MRSRDPIRSVASVPLTADVRWSGVLCGIVLCGALGCGDDEPAASPRAAEERPQADAPGEISPEPEGATLLEERGELTSTDPSDARGRFDRYFVDVGAQERVVVTVTSSAYDPILEVTLPGSGTLVNDDWQGDRTQSQLELISTAPGAMKVEVRSYDPEGSGPYELTVRRVGPGRSDGALEVSLLTVGRRLDGELSEDDHPLSTGERFDSYVVRVGDEPAHIAVSSQAEGTPVRTTLVGPDGRTLEPRGGRYLAPAPGHYRLQVIGRPGTVYRVSVQSAPGDGLPLFARAHHQFNELLAQLQGARSSGTPGSGGGTTGAPSAGPRGGEGPASPPSSPVRSLPVRIGDRLHGNLADNDGRLPSGEYFDVYELNVPADAGGPAVGSVAIELESSAFDCFLRVDGPGAQHWENDDYGGTLGSRLELPLAQPGIYRIVATSYRPGEIGPYELKVTAQRDDTSAIVTPGDAGPEQRIEGRLEVGDPQLRSGEFADEHEFEWPVGARIHLEARSTDFDTYLIVHPPNGPQRDNDDMVPGQSLNAGMDLQVTQAGRWRVVVTSYRPGETGAYTLVVGGATSSDPTPPASTAGASSGGSPPTLRPAGRRGGVLRTETGTLVHGDPTLNTGEFTDTYPMTFTPRSAVSIRLESTEFDPYLIVRSPSGHQEDNDDFAPGSLNSGLDIPVAEPGAYKIVVTSYRPGETGSYRLTVTEGPSIVTPPGDSGGGSPAARPTSAGGRVWGLFAGITDYPGGMNDLPECANDARKLAEAVRSQGNMPSEQEFLLTDAQVTADAVRSALRTVAQRIRPDDVFVFFYSGHGGQSDWSDDADELDRRDEFLALYEGQLLDDELGQLFDGIRARVALIAIDSCYSGGFAKDVITQPGRVGMFSSEEDVTSAVAGRFQAGGYLSHFLRLGIKGEADRDPNDDILTVGELTHYTWRQFGQHAADVRMSMGYQHLVVDRGAVPTTEVLWAVHR